MQINYNDEDWSIISSSSDMDDDQSTMSSKSQKDESSNNDKDEVGSSVATVKLPKLAACESSAMDAETTGSISQEQETGTTASSSRTSEPRNIDKVISFYEHLSSRVDNFNTSLKQRSHHFYQKINAQGSTQVCMSQCRSMRSNASGQVDRLIKILISFLNTQFQYIKSFKENIEKKSLYQKFIYLAVLLALSLIVVYFQPRLLKVQQPKPVYRSRQLDVFYKQSQMYLKKGQDAIENLVYETEKPRFKLFQAPRLRGHKIHRKYRAVSWAKKNLRYRSALSQLTENLRQSLSLLKQLRKELIKESVPFRASVKDLKHNMRHSVGGFKRNVDIAAIRIYDSSTRIRNLWGI